MSYLIGAEFLAGCATVEDWGCGKGWFSRFRTEGYVGVDGSASPFASKVVDLEDYTSRVDGIFMRHVLEHNYRWRKLLTNALASFRDRMVLAIFTPWSSAGTEEIKFVRDVGVPNLSLDKEELVAELRGIEWKLLELVAPKTMYGVEHVFLMWKREGARRSTTGS
ncbi:MAG: hypothetical protein ACRD2Z_11075 [Thermoanaerobaculia bacterium]